MGIGVRKEDVLSAVSVIGCSTFSSPFNYLGVKVGAVMSRLNSWNEVIDKISSRLSKWKHKTLSIGGRLTLLKLVLTAIPLYHMSLFKTPVTIIKRMESIRSVWTLGASGDFSVKSVHRLIDDTLLPKSDNPTRFIGVSFVRLVGALSSLLFNTWLKLAFNCPAYLNT
ncbi:hypothetical protein Tco_0694418 [Tanacetum coccineum]